jgi:hypothetical protein
VRAAILLISTHWKRTLGKLALSAIGIPLGTLHRTKQDKNDNLIVPHSIALRPHLHEHHQLARVLYSVANLGIESEQYHPFFDSAHVEEKCFFLTKEQLNLYLVPGETVPERSIRHKGHILMVMFLAAIARPWYNAAGECTFDGKIGMWPFVSNQLSGIMVLPLTLMA